MFKPVLLRVALLASACAFVSATPVFAQEQTRPINIAAGDLGPALEQYMRQAGVELVYSRDAVEGKTTQGLQGNFTSEEALQRLLEGSGLQIQRDPSGAILVANSVPPTQLGAADAGAEEEIVVTGTHIRGVSPASPVITVDREEIARAGQQTSGDVIRALPQNFSGGLNPGVVQAGGAQNINQGTASSTANLRGLGSDSTLTVVNGRRLAYTELGSSIDVSLIPLLAIERVEVLTDGASALYGAEAIAGVVNFILRDDYEGLTLDGAVGTSSDGGGELQRYGALAGATWTTGGVTASYEYLHQDPILASEREYTAASVGATTLMPGVERHSIFASAHQELTPRLSLSALGLYTDRDARRTLDLSFFLPGGISEDTSNVEQYGVVLGADFQVSSTWRASVFGTAAGNRQNVPQRVTLNGVEIPGGVGQSFETDLEAVEFVSDGVLFELPSGPVRLALGAGHREESFAFASIPAGFLNSVEGSREVEHIYVEALAPIFRGSADADWSHSLALSIAGRHEEYSDVGSTTNPKLGLIYEPHRDLELTASWGTSFRAPSLFQSLNPSAAYLFPNPGGGSPFLLLFGGNPDLEPETSESFTASARYAPRSVPGLSTQLTYFDLDYEGRIGFPFTNTSDPASDPAAQPFIVFGPSAAQVNDALAHSLFFNFTGSPFDPASVAYIADDRNANISRSQVRGLDLAANYLVETELGQLSFALNIARLELRQRTTEASANQTISGTVFNPPELRIRGGVGLERDRLSANLYVNHQSGSTDEAAFPPQDVDAWTTFDVTLAYNFATADERGARISLAISNLFDEEPPFVNAAQSGVPGLNYDATNASPVGRFMTLQLTQRF